MSRYIDADELKVEMMRIGNNAQMKRLIIETYIDKAPTADVKPIFDSKLRIAGITTMHYECSQCGEAVDKWDNYCKHCGARMKKESEEEE